MYHNRDARELGYWSGEALQAVFGAEVIKGGANLVKGGVKATQASKKVAQGTKSTKSLAKAAESIEKGAARATKVEHVAQQAGGVEAGVAQAAKVEQAAQRAEGVEHTTKVAKAEEVAPQGVEVRKGDIKVDKVTRQGARGGETRLLPKAFSRFSRFEYHFNKHAKEFGEITKDAYYKRALSLLESQTGKNIVGFTSKSGFTFRMNMKTGEFGVMRPNGVVETFYRRTKDLTAYWTEQVSKYHRNKI